MAINRLPVSSSESEDQLNLVIDNGDLDAVRAAAQKLGFRNEESMLRFVLAVLSKSATRSLTITDQNGAKISLSPSSDLLKENNSQ